MKPETIVDMEELIRHEILNVEAQLALPNRLLLFAMEGKRIRSKIMGSSFLASLVELTHVSSLIHDDIIDESNLRRGYPTSNSIMPIASASSIGYYIFSRLFLQIIRFKPFIYKNYFRILSEMCCGQIMEIQTMQHQDESIKQYLKTIRYKTGSLFAFCFGIKTDRWSKNDAALGYNYGEAFQILDDLYDVTLDEKTSGKPTRQDAKQGIHTLPFLFDKRSFQDFLFQKAMNAAKEKALTLLKKINLTNKPEEWQIHFLELEKKIKQVSCNISLENMDNNKNCQP
jgi:octaprenyl-diphosphate synthase